MKDILNMSEVDLNIACARFMGLDVVYLKHNELYNYEHEMVRTYNVNNIPCYQDMPEYSKSLDLMYQVEEKLFELGLSPQYVIKLDTLLNEHRMYNTYTEYLMVHASPLDRLKAVLLTIQEGE